MGSLEESQSIAVWLGGFLDIKEDKIKEMENTCH